MAQRMVDMSDGIKVFLMAAAGVLTMLGLAGGHLFGYTIIIYFVVHLLGVIATTSWATLGYIVLAWLASLMAIFAVPVLGILGLAD